MTEETLSAKNQIVIPREACEALGLKPGDKDLVVVIEGRDCSFLKNQSPIMLRFEVWPVALIPGPIFRKNARVGIETFLGMR